MDENRMDKRSLILSQVIAGTLNTVADEMSATVTRTARSPAVIGASPGGVTR